MTRNTYAFAEEHLARAESVKIVYYRDALTVPLYPHYVDFYA